MKKFFLLILLFSNLFADNKNLSSFTDNQKTGLMFLAIQNCNHKLINELLASGLDIDVTIDDQDKGVKNMTALHFAVAQADEDTVKLLLENNASLDKIMVYGEQEFNVLEFSKYCLQVIEKAIGEIEHQKNKLAQNNDQKSKDEISLLQSTYESFIKRKIESEAINQLLQNTCRKKSKN